MDQVKIGRFIAACRKAGGWTQSEIAAQLGVSDKAVSKWETGKSLPDYPLLPLCSLLKITLNELLLAERISDAEYKEKSDQILYDMIGQWLGQDQALPQRKRNMPMTVPAIQPRFPHLLPPLYFVPMRGVR